MYYTDLPIYAQILWIFFGLLVLLPWVAIPAIAIYKFIHVMRMPKTQIAAAKLELDTSNLGLTMADGGESVENNNKK